MGAFSANILWAEDLRKERFPLVVFELNFQFIITNVVILNIIKYSKVYLNRTYITPLYKIKSNDFYY